MVFERGAVARAGAGAVQARRRAVLQPGAPAGQRARRDFSELRRAVLQHRRARRLLRRERADRTRRRAAGVADKCARGSRSRPRRVTNLKADERRRRDSRARAPTRRRRSTRTRMRWFDGAGDNADGLAVMRGAGAPLREAGEPARAHAGVHRERRPPHARASTGRAGSSPPIPIWRPGADDAEHRARGAAQLLAGAQRRADGYRQAIADSGEAPIYAGVTNEAPFLNALFQQGVTAYGMNFVSARVDDAERRDRRLLGAEGRRA